MPPMLVFIDDSGDPGFKIEKGSSKFFVISAVIFEDDLEAEKAAVSVKELRRSLKFPDDVEFKFNKSSGKIRKSFLETVKKFDFKIRSLVVDKKVIHSQELKSNKNSFYSYTIKLLLKHNRGSILNAKVRIDGGGDRLFRKNFLAYLRKQLNSKQARIMKNCKLVNSKNDVLIQMVDMVAGSIRRFHESSKEDSKVYREIIKKHIQDEWLFA